MSRQINQPINQVRLTNVATVRMNKGGKRFEVACYRNKVVNYRQGIETDLSEVLQTERVFTNVSKGEFAKSADLLKVFGTADEEEIIKVILDKGNLQVSDLERTQQYESMSRDIATWISEHCVHPVTQRPYTIPQIRQAMKQAEYTIHPTRSMKKQYLDCFKQIEEKGSIKIVRAKMQLQLVYPKEVEETVKKNFQDASISPSDVKEEGDSIVATMTLDPSLYRILEDLSKLVDGRLEILNQVVMREGDSNLEQEMLQNKESQLHADETNLVSQQLEAQLHVQDGPPASAVVHHTRSGDQNDDSDSEKDDEDVQDHDEVQNVAISSSQRKNQKRAQKKSKKAKRREKEEVEERQIRLDAEAKRREERGIIEPTSMAATATEGDGSGGKPCNTCGGAFANMTEYRAHFRSDWHRYNIKLKMKGVTPISEKEFLVCDSDAFFDVM